MDERPAKLKSSVKTCLSVLVVAAALGTLTACSTRQADRLAAAEMFAEDLDGLKELKMLRDLKKTGSSKRASEGNDTIRLENIKQTARELGAQGGLSFQTRKLNAILEYRSSLLTRIFNFNYLMLNQQILPPVLEETSGYLTQEDDFTLKISGHLYRIVQQPRLVTTPPNWRNYLQLHYEPPEIPNVSLLPKNNREQLLWSEYVRIGWAEGIEQADLIFTNNLAKLKRDFLGMILYRKLLAQNMISRPYIAKTELGIKGDGNNLDIDSKVLRITAVPQFNTDQKKWSPVVVPEASNN